MTESEKTPVTTGSSEPESIDNLEERSEPSIPNTVFKERVSKIKELTAKQYEGEIQEWRAKYEWLEGTVKQKEQEWLRNVAIAKYGEEIVNNEKVAEVMSKYDGMWYDEAIKLAWLEPKKFGWMPVAKTPTNILKDTGVMYWDDLPNLNPQERKLVKEQAKRGEIRIERRGN